MGNFELRARALRLRVQASKSEEATARCIDCYRQGQQRINLLSTSPRYRFIAGCHLSSGGLALWGSFGVGPPGIILLGTPGIIWRWALQGSSGPGHLGWSRGIIWDWALQDHVGAIQGWVEHSTSSGLGTPGIMWGALQQSFGGHSRDHPGVGTPSHLSWALQESSGVGDSGFSEKCAGRPGRNWARRSGSV